MAETVASLTKKLNSLFSRIDALQKEVSDAKEAVNFFIEKYEPRLDLLDSKAPSEPKQEKDPNDPLLFVMPIGDLDSVTFQNYLIHQAFLICEHREPNEKDWAYWRSVAPACIARGREINVPNYFWLRLIGWQAGLGDKPTYGPYRKSL